MRRKFLIPSILAGLSVLAVGAVPAQARLFKDRSDCASSSRFERDLDVVGLTADGKLVCFEDDDPRDADRIGTVTGLQVDTKLVGIDYRPATGDLYGLGNAGGVYVVDASNAKASLRSRLNVALEGTQFGVDFNPTVDRLRDRVRHRPEPARQRRHRRHHSRTATSTTSARRP